MRQTHRCRQPAYWVVLIGALAGAVPAHGQCRTTEPTYSSFLYLATWPDNDSPGWHSEVQGLAHDDDHWYITQKYAIWRIPAQHDLSHDASAFPRRHISSYTQLAGYKHFGDADCYRPPGGGPRVLIVPVEGTAPQPAIAFFHADDTLECYGKANLAVGQGSNAAWAAVDPQGLLYSSPDGSAANQLYAYKVNWGELASGKPPSLTHLRVITLLDEDSQPLPLEQTQGGEFAPAGDLFYFATGFYDGHYQNDGINVFDTTTWKRIRRAAQEVMPFLYHFDAGGVSFEEPEGLTVWDLTDCQAPGVGGEIHALVLNNGAPDTVRLLHYADSMCVDQSFTGQSDWGKPHAPFTTVGQANDAAWDGARIKIKGGSYPETLVLSKRLQVLSQGGVVRIGAP